MIELHWKYTLLPCIDCVFIMSHTRFRVTLCNHLTSLTKWLGVFGELSGCGIAYRSSHFRASSSLSFRQLQSVDPL